MSELLRLIILYSCLLSEQKACHGDRTKTYITTEPKNLGENDQQIRKERWYHPWKEWMSLNIPTDWVVNIGDIVGTKRDLGDSASTSQGGVAQRGDRGDIYACICSGDECNFQLFLSSHNHLFETVLLSLLCFLIVLLLNFLASAS